ncbi:MAG: hypothetical protein IPH78_13595 [Bacteroidetes bacterium]|nr:hypothetical protein [Bacteroidota bacterium]
MIDLIKYFRILFMSPQISRERLRQFAESHIQRLTVNNPGGIYGAILAAITTAYSNFAGNLVDAATLEASSKALTLAMNDAQKAVHDKIREFEPLLDYTYRANRPVYLEFYPQGLTEYDAATNAVFQTIAQRFQAAMNAHLADFPPAEAAAFNTLMTTYLSSINNELAGEGNVAGERTEIADTRLALCTQLTTNLLTIALNNVGNEAQAAVYFDQSILDAAFATNTAAEGDLDPGATANAFSNTSKPDTQYRFKLLSEGSVSIFFKDSETSPVTLTEGKQIVSGQDWQTYTASDIGYSSTDRYLNITNTGTATTSFIIERV